MPESLKTALKARAVANRRSLNSELVKRLEETLEREATRVN